MFRVIIYTTIATDRQRERNDLIAFSAPRRSDEEMSQKLPTMVANSIVPRMLSSVGVGEPIYTGMIHDGRFARACPSYIVPVQTGSPTPTELNIPGTIEFATIVDNFCDISSSLRRGALNAIKSFLSR